MLADVHAGFDAIDHNDIFSGLSGIYIGECKPSRSAAVEQTCCVGVPSEASRNALHVCIALHILYTKQLLPASLMQ